MLTKKSYRDALYPATRAYPFSEQDLAVVWAADIIEGTSDSVYYAERSGAGKSPEVKKSYRVSRKNIGTSEQEITVHASHKFFDAVAEWWPKAQEAISAQ